jgi:hypothetical protein
MMILSSMNELMTAPALGKSAVLLHAAVTWGETHTIL